MRRSPSSQAPRARLALAAGAAALFGFGGAAQAGDAACLWNNLSPGAKDAFLAAYATQGPNATEALTKDVEGLVRAIMACKVDEQASGLVAGEALAGHALRVASLDRLGKAHNIREPQLVAAWEAIPSARRATFAKTMLAAYESGADPDEASIRTFMEVLDRTGAKGDDAQTQVMVWLVSTIMLADREARF